MENDYSHDVVWRLRMDDASPYGLREASDTLPPDGLGCLSLAVRMPGQAWVFVLCGNSTVLFDDYVFVQEGQEIWLPEPGSAFQCVPGPYPGDP